MPRRKSDLAFNPPLAPSTAAAAANTLTLSSVPAKAALEIAEGTRTPHAVLSAYGYDDITIDWLLQHKPFVSQIERYRAELQATGYTFRAKASFLAEQHLDTTHKIIASNDTPPQVRLDAIKFLAKMGNLEPKESATGATDRFSITINMPSTPAPVTIDT
jgi:hypothetical protein